MIVHRLVLFLSILSMLGIFSAQGSAEGYRKLLGVGTVLQAPAGILPLLLADFPETLSRKAHARSLAASSAAEFKKLQLQAASYEKINRALLACAFPGSLLFFASAFELQKQKKPSSQAFVQLETTGLKQRRRNLLPNMLTAFGVYSAASFFFALPVRMARVVRRIKLHQRFARHAEELFDLMHTSSFMESLGIQSWEMVARERIKTENWAIKFGAVPLVGFMMKPIVKKIAERKSDCPGLEKKLIAYLNGLGGYKSRKGLLLCQRCHAIVRNDQSPVR